ncbi:ABC transporter permease [Gabonibacter chumensis]|uniref:ABC transporter permease n=1 Tax=Gabonibacter chumensis TaxID=2972474 RepID=UPI0025732405|nr:ABC transporter permease [Gabonibacter chumensis]MCR9012634.1 ABC transporter permease [Gabonibacter chumensis]
MINFTRTFRIIFRNKGLTWINITGLSLGLAIALFLLVYLKFEFSYDKHFKDADRIYKILCAWKESGCTEYYATNIDLLASQLIKEVPEIETACRLYNLGIINVRNKDKEKTGVKAYMVDSTFLQIFNFKLLNGNLNGALDEPNTCIITRSTANRFFSTETDPIGKSLIDDDNKSILKIVAVIEDIPANTHFNFDLITKLPEFDWGGLAYHTYVKFRPGIDQKAAIGKCNAINKKLLESRFISDNYEFGSAMESLLDIHIQSKADYDLKRKADKTNLIFIILITLFILAIALSNFISLYVIQGEKRSKEISIRKTNGASRIHIAGMLFGETFIVTSIAFLIAIILYFSFSSTFTSLLNFNLPEEISIDWFMWGNFILLFLVVSFIAGSYPAYYLSRFNPVELISKSTLRKYKLTATSVVVQFAVVIFCISALLVVWRQLNFMKAMPLGFETENILTINITSRLSQYNALYSDLLRCPEIENISVSQGDPLDGYSEEGIRKMGQSEKEELSIRDRRTGPGYFSLFHIPILEGRSFIYENQTDSKSLILNETAVTDLGLKEPVGQNIIFNDQIFKIIGIAKDIKTSAREKNERLAYTAYATTYWTLAVKFKPDTYQKTKMNVNSIIEKYFAQTPYTSILMSDAVRYQYKQDEITSRILISGSILAITLASLGLLALSGFVTRQKRKEISIRRAMGAQINEIIYDLNKYILLRVLPAFPIGIILSYFIMRHWLQNFEYSITLSWWIFGISLLLTSLIALLTILYQSIRSATKNPAEALKNE